MTAIYLLVALGLLVANGFFVAAEVAVTAAAARRSTIEELARRGGLRSRMARASVRELSFMLTGAQLGITMASLGLGFVAEPAIADGLVAALTPLIEIPGAAIHAIAAVIALTIVVFLHMVLAEMAPKNLAIADPIRTVLWIAVPFRLYANTFRVVLWTLNGAANWVVRLLRVHPREELATSYTSGQIESILRALRQLGAIDASAHRLAARALGFRTRKVHEAMVPRSEAVAVSLRSTPNELERLVVRTGFSRFPVYNAGPDDIEGFVHAKDLLGLDEGARDQPIPRRIVRPLPVVPEAGEVGQLLAEMRRRRSHMALVIDEHGSAAGIVTLEDLAEELVGEIRDEHDRARARVQRAGRDRFVVAGNVRVDELRAATGLGLPDGDYSTVAGFVMARLGAVPNEGQSVRVNGWVIRVRRMEGPRVEALDIVRPTNASPVGEAGAG